jgi:hypothetical protein
VSRKILAHVRNADIFALLTPLVVLTPVSPPFGLQPDRFGKMKLREPRCWSPLSVSRPGHSRPITGFSYPVTGGCDRPAQTQRCQARPQRLFVRWVPDLATYAGRLVGPNYIANNSLWYFRALQLKNVNQFLGMLKEYEIDAVLLTPSTPAAGLLDQFEGCSASAQTRPLWCIFPTRKLLANGRHDGALDE